jgi:hypothetical protein
VAPRKLKTSVQDNRSADRDSKEVSSEYGAEMLTKGTWHEFILYRIEYNKPDIILTNKKINTNIKQLSNQIFMKDNIHKPYIDRYE